MNNEVSFRKSSLLKVAVNMVTIDMNEDSSCKKVAFAIYCLYLISIVFPLLAIIGVIFAYIFENDARTFLKSHYQYLIRSFWIGLLYFSISVVTIIFIVGIFLVPLSLIWWLIRLAKGIKSLMRHEAIAHPKTWLF